MLIITGLAALLLIAIIGGGLSMYRASSRAVTSAKRVADAFLWDMRTHDYTAAHELVAPVARSKATVRDLKDYQLYIDHHFGKPKTLGDPQWYVGTFNGQTNVQLRYREEYANGSATVLVVLIPTTDGYRIVSWNNS